MQTPAPFDYERATSVDGAIAALQRLGPEARIIAGGHSLLPMMKLRLASPSHLVDINDLHELAYIREEGDELAIGALTRHVDLLESDLLAAAYPAFRDAEQVIADPVVRNRGTIGGSLCQADAAEDLSAVCAAAKARVVIRGPERSGDEGAARGSGARTVAMSEFHLGPWTTAVGDGEMLTEVRLPLKPGAGSAHEKVERRAGDWAIAAASAAVWMEGSTIADVGIALGSVGPTTIEATAAEAALRGQVPSEELLDRAAQLAAAGCSPIPDGRGPVDYKRHLAGVLTRRALRRAIARALQQEA
jgi:aerobic carbon-monoxide dehydrogenase medium subunit